MNERKLASIQCVDEIKPIKNADAIELAVFGGWQVIVKKGEYAVGDFCIFAEIDSWVPHSLAPFLARGKEPRVFEGIPGNVLKTIKMRGVISQGLVLPLSLLSPFMDISEMNEFDIGMDVSELLGIIKYERPIPVCLVSIAKGNFPSFIPKTDQERAQNLTNKIFNKHKDTVYEITTKMDGASITIYHNEGIVGVCSRNLDLKLTDDTSAFIQAFNKSGMHDVLISYGRNIAFQGELVGHNIQNNSEKVPKDNGYQIWVYNIFDIDTQKYLLPIEREGLFRYFIDIGVKIHHVPMLGYATISDLKITNIEGLIEFANHPGVYNEIAEGKVFKSLDGELSWKIISNDWLLKYE